MEATRQLFWNIDGNNLIYIATLVAFLIFFFGFSNKIRTWCQGRSDIYRKNMALRALNLFWYVIRHHPEIFKSPFRRTMHLAVFYGFIILLIGTVAIALQHYFNFPTFTGLAYLLLSFLLDIFGLLGIIGIVMAAYKRYIVKKDIKSYTVDDAVTLVFIFVILITGFILEGLRIYATGDVWARWTPVGQVISIIVQQSGMTVSVARSVHAFLWYCHMLLALGFIAYIPYSKLLHMLASPLNIFLKSSSRIGNLSLIGNISAQTSSLGAARLEDFTKKQLMELDACLSCLRCEKNCPAYENVADFSPRILVQTLKKHARHRYSFLGRIVKNYDSGLIDKVISREALLSCTTCGVCEQKCPVNVEHIKRIIDMRRSFMSRLDNCTDGLEDYRKLFDNLKKQGNPWGLSPGSIKDWGVPLISEKKHTDVLFWVGCFGTNENRNNKVTRVMLNILKKSGLDFAVMGGEENCCGDVARRLGNEPLFQQLATANIKDLSRYKFNMIVTTCPHCYNTFKNEYTALGGNYRVLHHSELILELIESGRIKPKAMEKSKVTFHDPCYLGRYNKIYDEPRKILLSIPGIELAEMIKNKEKSYCCGAGGGKIWMEDQQKEKTGALCVQEAMKTGADKIVSSCPLCLANLTNVADRLGLEIKTMDIAEMIDQSI